MSEMIQATALIGGGHDIAQYNDDGQRVRGICEAYDPFWCDVLLDVLEAWEAAQYQDDDDPCSMGPTPYREPVSQYQDAREAAELVGVQ